MSDDDAWAGVIIIVLIIFSAGVAIGWFLHNDVPVSELKVCEKTLNTTTTALEKCNMKQNPSDSCDIFTSYKNGTMKCEVIR